MRGLKLLVYAASGYKCFRPEAASVCGFTLLEHEAILALLNRVFPLVATPAAAISIHMPLSPPCSFATRISM